MMGYRKRRICLLGERNGIAVVGSSVIALGLCTTQCQEVEAEAAERMRGEINFLQLISYLKLEQPESSHVPSSITYLSVCTTFAQSLGVKEPFASVDRGGSPAISEYSK